MTRFFDSLTHVTADGSWLGKRVHDASAARLFEELDKCDPWRACVVAIAGYVDNETVLRTARTCPDRLVPIGSFNPVQCASAEAIREEARKLASNGFVGLKLHPRLNGYDPLQSEVVSAIHEAGERGLVVFLDTLFRQPGRGTPNAADVVDELAARCPRTRIVLLHGGGAQLLAMSEVVAAHPNLFLDLSFTLLRYEGSSLDADLRFLLHALDRRIVVGSDFPEYTPSQAKQRVIELGDGLPTEKLDNVLYGNLAALIERREAST